MDFVAACRAFTAVAVWGSFTSGAAAEQIPQSVASRRIAALEQRLGDRLLHRTSRTVQLTPFGHALLPSAQRLIDAEDAFILDAERAVDATSLLALPAGLSLLAQAQVVRAASSWTPPGARTAGRGTPGAGTGGATSPDSAWEVTTAPPAQRAALVATGRVRAAVVPVPAARARWSIRLGLAGRPSPTPPGRLTDLRPSRSDTSAPRSVWVGEEDEVEGIRGPLAAAAPLAGLLPSQVRGGGNLVAALASVLDGDDVVLASADEAERWGLTWSVLQQPLLTRGYDLAATDPDDAATLLSCLGAALGSALGADRQGTHR